MTTIFKRLYEEYQESLPYADPRTRDWFMVNNNPVYVWILSAMYLLSVWLGPKYMKNRKAYSLNTFLVIYNMFLVVLSLYMFVEIWLSTSAAEYPWLCVKLNAETRKDPRELRVAKVMWWYFFSKAIEFMDTILMVLRKKNSQISFLHVFHHVSMFNIWWWVMMFIPGGLAYFGSGLNCLVHVVMYAYYGLAAIPSLRGKLWWKNYITKFQLIQFCVTLTHTVNSVIIQCEFPRWGQYLLGGYMILMLVLFMNFYIRAYILQKQKRKQEEASRRPRASENGSSSYTNGNTQYGKSAATNGTATNGIPHQSNHHINNGHAHTKKSV